MIRGWFIPLIALSLTSIVVAPAYAVDEVSQKGKANSAKGTITQINKKGVTIKPRIGPALTIPANEIERVRWDGEPPRLNLARSAEAAGRFKEALQGYAEAAADSKSEKENIKIDIEYSIARTTGRFALIDSSRIDEATQKLEAQLRSQPDHFHFYNTTFVLGQVYMVKKDYIKAKMSFDVLTRSPWTDYQMAANSANAKLLLLQDDVSGALQAFQSVIVQDASAPAEKSRRFEAMLGKANCLTRQKKFPEALETLSEVVQQASPEDTRVQAESYVRQGDCLRAQGRVKEAILAYLHIPVLFSNENDLHAESLHHLVTLWDEVGKPERGADARQELQTRFPNTEWAKKLGGS